MKIPLWYLVVLLACLFTPGRSDCQGECAACGLLMQQQLQQAFNTMVCLLECEGHVSGSLTWEVCRQAAKVPRYPALTGGERQPREERYAGGNGQLKTDEGDTREATALSKRFGGFQRGRHGYRKLIGSPVRPLQKRYGGFIGVRKSARKWNSQKRVNQLLRQYLGMRSSRSGRFNVPVTRPWRQNKL
ncbi:unnamed protein product [Tetraodon nigroviridis]|uniref:(spotted green pufferfish) hypothetical protein n=1 Tax=Tetraodon nigroviridis TaxID=99883 RepID=Q4RF41_TETNG|nr:unnamed protein product [Tetraodon nigroviridis]